MSDDVQQNNISFPNRSLVYFWGEGSYYVNIDNIGWCVFNYASNRWSAYRCYSDGSKVDSDDCVYSFDGIGDELNAILISEDITPELSGENLKQIALKFWLNRKTALKQWNGNAMIQFRRKNTMYGVVIPSIVDNEMCKHFGTVQGRDWYENWYNRFLLDFMLGKQPVPENPTDVEILKWLNENFDIVI